MSPKSVSIDELEEKLEENPDLELKVDEEEVKRRIFVRDALPGEWRNYAHELKDSAEELWQGKRNSFTHTFAKYIDVENGDPFIHTDDRVVSSISRSYVLLAGFALENLLKGLKVSSDPSLITDGSLDDELKTHNVADLAGDVEEVEVTDAEMEFCELAESAIPYWGRYPVPLSKNSVVASVGIDEEDREDFLSLFEKLDEELYVRIRDGWESGIGVKSGPKYDRQYDPEERREKVKRVVEGAPRDSGQAD